MLSSNELIVTFVADNDILPKGSTTPTCLTRLKDLCRIVQTTLANDSPGAMVLIALIFPRLWVSASVEYRNLRGFA